MASKGNNKIPSSTKSDLKTMVTAAAAGSISRIVPLAGGEFVRLRDPSTHKDVVNLPTRSDKFIEELTRLAELSEGQLRPKLISELHELQQKSPNPNWQRAIDALSTETA